MLINVDDVRINALRPLVPPAILLEDLPVTEDIGRFITGNRAAIGSILHGDDDRLIVITGPCSIHDPAAAMEYAGKLKALADRHAKELFIIMRVYFEKPRTTVGWKGLINDPFIDNSFQINKGLRIARNLLMDINKEGLPAGTEFLDTIIPQFIADLVSWAAIGARTSESQVHRELSSGLSMPVGFKNGTGGNIKMAVDATRSAGSPHWFPSVTKQGVAAIFETKGNENAHVILRGGSRTGPNYDAASIAEAVELLAEAGQPQRVMVDCSHGNSSKDHTRQKMVAECVAEQVSAGSDRVFGVMLESNLVEGKQEYDAGGNTTYGQSITDACINFDTTTEILDTLASAVRSRRAKR